MSTQSIAFSLCQSDRSISVDLERANKFYGEILGLPSAHEENGKSRLLDR